MPNVARFNGFELRVATGELYRDGTRVPLQDQPARLLGYLLEHAGQLVTREELRTALWPAEFVDFEHGLNTAIRKLRAALDDAADQPRFIETLARRGYRFIAPVTWDGAGEGAGAPQRAAEGGGAPRGAPRVIVQWALIAIAALVIVGTLLSRPRPQAKRVDSIAVLPFHNQDPATQHINDGFTEELIDDLSRVPELRVTASTTIFRYKWSDFDPRRMGKELGVAAVVSGRIRRDSNGYVLRVELVDSRDGAQLWGSNYDASPAQLPGLHGRIAADLAQALQHGSTGVSRYTTNVRAYDLYTRGLYAWKRRGRADLQHAIEYFNAAADADPNFASAYSGLANVYGVMVGYGWIPVTEGTTKVIANAQKALDLDPSNAEALVSMATTKFRNVWDFPGADADYRRALALNPNYATGHDWYAEYLRAMGRWDESRREIDLARQLDPYAAATNIQKCFSLYYERRYGEARAFIAGMTRVDPAFNAPLCVLMSFLAEGDTKSAAETVRGIQSPEIDFGQEVADAYARGGREAFFRKWANVLESGRDGEQPVGVAVMYAQLGDRNRAFAALERAYQTRTSRVTNINAEPLLEPLHSDPRWRDLLHRIGLPEVTPPPAREPSPAPALQSSR